MHPEGVPPRRSFLVRLAAAAVGVLGLLLPMAPGLAVLVDPLRRRSPRSGARRLPIAPLDAIPEDGTPCRFPVVADQRDAWTLAADERIGAVYLRRVPGEETVQAFNAVCPHAGCFIGFNPQDGRFECPCHTSAFTLDGQVIAPSPSPRDMDALETEVTPEGVVLVEFANFYTGRPEKVVRS